MNIPIESLSLIMLNVGFARHHADWNWQEVSSPFTRLFLVTDGEAKVHLPHKVVTLRPGHAYMVPAYVTHRYDDAGRAGLDSHVTKGHLIRLFRQTVGISPQKYRKRNGRSCHNQ